MPACRGAVKPDRDAHQMLGRDLVYENFPIYGQCCCHFFPVLSLLLGERCPTPTSWLPGLYRGPGLRQRGCIASPERSWPLPLKLHILIVVCELYLSNLLMTCLAAIANLFVFLKLPPLGVRCDPGVSYTLMWRFQLKGHDPGICRWVSWEGCQTGMRDSAASTCFEPVCLCPHGVRSALCMVSF